MRYMYQNSNTRIKLIQKVSDVISVTIGTEQGHPMSPELFKMFIYDLSTELEGVLGIKVPNLNNYKRSHLLWADDLILIAEDAESLQKLMDVLHDYVVRWELEINTSKTNIMVFNKSGRLLNCSYGFKLGETSISPTKNYTYLGIVFSLNGSFKSAIDHLSKKAMRAYFSMKRTVNIKALNASSVLKLFDYLIKPIATYGSQIWLPSTNVCKALVNNKGNLLQASAKDKIELMHLKLLKWTFGIHKKASNTFCYGDSGRIPLALAVLPQGVNYFRRLANNVGTDDSLSYHAFVEQQTNSFEWYRTWSYVNNILDQPVTAYGDTSPHLIQERVAKRFISDWDQLKLEQRKLTFYSSVKSIFGEEPYLLNTNFTVRRAVARIRSSAHDLNVEKGRYKRKSNPNEFSYIDRLCRFCCSDTDKSTEALLFLENLPFYEPIVEDEVHMLTVCSTYHCLRMDLSENLKTLVVRNDYHEMMSNPYLINEFGRFLEGCFKIRHPQIKNSTQSNVTSNGHSIRLDSL